MSLKYRIVAAIVLCTLAAVAMVGLPQYLGARSLIETAGARELAQVEAQIKSALHARTQTALSLSRLVANTPRVERAMAKQDHRALTRLYSRNFEAFAQEAGVAQFQFHSPDAHSVLRVHNLDKRGDDLSGFRKTVVEANRTQASVAGLERGRAGIGIRGISPINNGKGHVGTVEFGIALNADLMREIIAGSGALLELYLLPDTAIDTFDATSQTLTRLSVGHEGDAMLDNAQVLAAAENALAPQSFLIGEKHYAGATFVLEDFSGNPVAVAHALVPRAGYQMIKAEALRNTLLAVLAAVAFSAVLAFLFGRFLTSQLNKLVSRMTRLAEGDTAITVEDFKGKGREITAMAQRLEVFRDGLIEADRLSRENARARDQQEALVAVLADGLQRVAQGDLSARIDADLGEVYAGLVQDFNTTTDQLSEVIAEISGASERVNAVAGDIGHSATDLSRRTETSAATLEQTAAALEEITTAVKQSSEGARTADSGGHNAIQKARTGAEVVSATVDAIKEIDDSSEEIARITEVIDDIAFQTNLLALNAGVEAARAGEAGSGFAVVAAEVQALAHRTTDAARQIGGLIATSGDRVSHGVTLVSQTGAALDDILEAIETVTQQIGLIAASAEEQSRALSEINTAVGALDATTQENAGLFHRVNDTGEELIRESMRLKALVERFSDTASDPGHGTEQCAA